MLKSKAPAPSEERVEIILTAIDNEESEKPLFCSTLELDQGEPGLLGLLGPLGMYVCICRYIYIYIYI